MTSSRHMELQRIFTEACRLRPEKRRAFVDEACKGDADLRIEIDAMLAADDAADGATGGFDAGAGANILARELAQNSELDGPAHRIPDSIGPYRILGVLGRGGMGIVYRAEQRNPRRTVALKVVHPGLLRDDTLRRFTQETHVLGLLQHPGIASIHDASTCDFGYGEVPYFVMELVDGTAITQFASENGLDNRAKLQLVARVCDAVQHAHEQGVVHRDLKPANVLVIEETTSSGGPQPKILDFGIARTTDAGLQFSTMKTSTGLLLGTLPYMSPEQVTSRGVVDTRSDVYSLGVILYELLVGNLPLDFEGRPLTDVARIVHDEDPVRLGRLDRSLRGDVETICDKALAKEREYRYDSAKDLGEDLRRFLRNEPIQARPLTTWYQLAKLARRHKTLVGGALTTCAALITGIVVALLLLFRAERGEALAKQNRRAARRGNYVARIAAASATIASDPVTAMQALADAPEELRGWEWDYLRARADPTELHFDPPRGTPCDVAFRTDGTPLCLARDRDTLLLYDMTRGTVLHRLAIAPEYQDAFLSRDGTRIGLEQTDEHGDSTHLVVSDTESGAARTAHGAASRDGFARALDSHAAQFRGARAYGQVSISLSNPDHTISLLGTIHNRFVELSDATSKKTLRTLYGHQAPIYHAAFTPDSTRVVTSCTGDSTVRIWDTASGLQERVVFVAKPGRLAISKDGTRIATISDGSVEVFTTEDAASRTLPVGDYVYSLAIDDKHGLVAARTHSGAVNLFALPSGKRLGRWYGGTGRRVTIESGRELRIADGDFVLVDIARLTPNQIPSQPPPRTEIESSRSSGHIPKQLGERGRATSADRRQIATCHTDGSIAIYDLATGERVATMRGHAGPATCLAFLPDGSRLVSGGNDQTVRLWDTRTFDQVAVLRGHTNYVHCIAVSSDGNRIVTGSGDRTVRIWDRRPQRARGAEHAHREAVWAACRPRVLTWIRELRDPAAVADRVRDDRALDAQQRVVVRRRLVDLIGFRDSDSTDPRVRADAYFALVAAASANLDEDIPIAWEYLSRCPTELRGPEWHRLRDAEPDYPVRTAHAREGRPTDCVAFREDGTPLYAFEENGRVEIVDIAARRTMRVLQHDGGITRPSMSVDGRRLLAWGLVAEKPRTLLEWDIASGDLMTTAHDCLHAGGTIVVGSSRHVAWRHPTSETIGFSRFTVFDLDNQTPVQCNAAPDTRAFFRPDGQCVDIGFKRLDLRAGVFHHTGSRNATLNRGARLIAQRNGTEFCLSKNRHGAQLRPLAGHAGQGYPIAFNADSRWFAATLAPAERIAVWNVATRERCRTIAATALAFSPCADEVLVATKRGAKVIPLTQPVPERVETRLDAEIGRALRRLEAALTQAK